MLRCSILAVLCAVLSIACDPATPIGYTPPPSAPADLAGPTADIQPGQRLQRLNDPWWWWQNPNDTVLIDYVRNLWGPIARRPFSAPLTFQPMWDTRLQARCLFYKMTDGKYHCLPGFAQVAEAMFTRDGFYVETSGPHGCWDYEESRLAIPVANHQKLLILYIEADHAYRVFDALLETKAVYDGRFEPPMPWPACRPATTRLNYFTRGSEHFPPEFEPLPPDQNPPT